MATKKAAPKKEKKEKKEKKIKIAFVKAAASVDGLLDDAGRLTAPPGEHFDSKEHAAPKKTDFSAEYIYLRFRADQLEQRANDDVARAAALREQADVMEKQPDPATRNQVKRRQKLMEQLAKIEEQLAAEGIELN